MLDLLASLGLGREFYLIPGYIEVVEAGPMLVFHENGLFCTVVKAMNEQHALQRYGFNPVSVQRRLVRIDDYGERTTKSFRMSLIGVENLRLIKTDDPAMAVQREMPNQRVRPLKNGRYVPVECSPGNHSPYNPKQRDLPCIIEYFRVRKELGLG